jgi:hypothetical protein
MSKSFNKLKQNSSLVIFSTEFLFSPIFTKGAQLDSECHLNEGIMESCMLFIPFQFTQIFKINAQDKIVSGLPLCMV